MNAATLIPHTEWQGEFVRLAGRRPPSRSRPAQSREDGLVKVSVTRTPAEADMGDLTRGRDVKDHLRDEIHARELRGLDPSCIDTGAEPRAVIGQFGHLLL